MPTLSPIQSPDPDRTSSTTRILKAPRELVFRAWMEADHLKNWWGPNGFSNSFNVFEPQPDGRWDFTMHGLTCITFTQIFESAELFEKIKDFIADKNKENLDRLESELKKMN
jgi:hypothetical protein